LAVELAAGAIADKTPRKKSRTDPEKRHSHTGTSVDSFRSLAARPPSALTATSNHHLISLGLNNMASTVKGVDKSATKIDGSSLRVAIVHARWNKSVIDALLAGAIAKLKESGVKESNIVVESVPGSFELPLACQRSVFFFPFSLFTLFHLLKLYFGEPTGSSPALTFRPVQRQPISLAVSLLVHRTLASRLVQAPPRRLPQRSGCHPAPSTP
jgi:hypothetical protein